MGPNVELNVGVLLEEVVVVVIPVVEPVVAVVVPCVVVLCHSNIIKSE